MNKAEQTCPNGFQASNSHAHGWGFVLGSLKRTANIHLTSCVLSLFFSKGKPLSGEPGSLDDKVPWGGSGHVTRFMGEAYGSLWRELRFSTGQQGHRIIN